NRRTAAARGVELQDLPPPRREVAQILLLSGVLLRHLQFEREHGLLQLTEQRRHRLADLEVRRSVLDLQYDVLLEPPVERDQVVVRRPRTIRTAITPIVRLLITGIPPEHRPAVRRNRPREQVRALGVTARPNYEPAEIRY